MSTTAELCAALRRRAQEASFRIEQTKENTSKRTQQETIMNQCTVAIKRLDVGISSYAALLEAITSYTDERRRDGNTAVMSAMRGRRLHRYRPVTIRLSLAVKMARRGLKHRTASMYPDWRGRGSALFSLL